MLVPLFDDTLVLFFCLQLLQRRNGLNEKAARRRLALEESYKLQTFERDYDETKIWINEKLKAASDYEGYLVSGIYITHTYILYNISSVLTTK